jgi:predicted N-formylglutamate amidohydrolase
MNRVIRDAFTDAGEPDDPLLGPDDPSAYQIVNPRGSSNVVFMCDHASNAVPMALDNLGLTDEQLSQHIAWDIGAADVTRRLAAHFDAPAVLAGYSRLVIDCNRQLDDPESIMTQSDGHDIPGNRNLTDADAARRTEACFWPYHQASQAVIEGVEARGVVPAIVMMHSFTPAMGHAPRPWHIGVLWDRDDRIAAPLLHNLRERGDLCVGDNEPYTGASPHGYSMPVHAAQHGRANIQIELRQDLIDDEVGIETWARVMIDAFAPIFADPDLFRHGP